MGSTAPTKELSTLEQAQEFYDAVFDEDMQQLLDKADDGNDEARETLEGMTYGVWKQVTYYVTLAGGGPAARLAVEVDDYGEVENAWLEYADWFAPWTSAPRQDPELVKRLATVVGYYGE
ncbi:hypothetical protein ACU639_17825 [Streptomyces cynarae]|uniref:hypothetical protein n=1 Tax=Streptomyces cynarae TaxID=2981134 RepID=UPI00406D4789